MSRHAWLTPDDTPGAAICRPVYIPSGEAYEAALRGALLLLCDTFNWEEHGTQTPQDVSAAFYDAFLSTLDNWGDCSQEGNNFVVGEIRIIPTLEYPPGWILCDGSILYADEYPLLFQAVGATFGGDGVSTFGIPDLRGRMPISTGTGSGLTERVIGDTGGEESHQLAESELPAHDHTINHNHAGNRSFVSFAQGSAAGANLLRDTAGTAGVTTAHSGASGNAGGDGSHENMPPFLALPYLIYTGIEY